MRTHGLQRGVAMIELAVCMTLLTTLVFGVTEFGRAIMIYDTLAKSARDATRFLTVRDPSAAGNVADAKCMAVYGNPNCTGTPLAPGLTTAMVSICYAADPTCAPTFQSQGASPVVNLVAVTIGGAGAPYVFTSVVPALVPSFNFGAISVTMRQVL